MFFFFLSKYFRNPSSSPINVISFCKFPNSNCLGCSFVNSIFKSKENFTPFDELVNSIFKSKENFTSFDELMPLFKF